MPNDVPDSVERKLLLPVLDELIGKPLKELIDNTSAAAGTIGKELGPTIESIVNFLFKEFIPAVVTLAKRVGVGLLPIIKTAAGFIKLSIGRRMPAIAATCPDRPATTMPTFLARIAPRVVCTPLTTPFSMSMPVTSQFWMISTPR